MDGVYNILRYRLVSRVMQVNVEQQGHWTEGRCAGKEQLWPCGGLAETEQFNATQGYLGCRVSTRYQLELSILTGN